MCLVLDQFLWGHSSRVCDISCFKGNIAHFLGALSFCYFNPTNPVVLLYVRCKSGVYFARRHFHDVCLKLYLMTHAFDIKGGRHLIFSRKTIIVLVASGDQCGLH